MQRETHMRTVFGNSSAERFDDAGIDVEEIITGHTGLSGDTSRDDNNIRSLQSFSQMLFTRIPRYLFFIKFSLNVNVKPTSH